MALIEVNNVSKDFLVYKRKRGFLNSLKSLIIRDFEIKNAAKDINFSIDRGELVGYIGANGAGKSTTIKMLSGILTPTEGNITVDGRIPYQDRKENALRMGVVFGQRSHLFWDLPMVDTFDLYKKMYKIDDITFKHNLEFFIELLEMKEFLNRPVRQLSLGQKMRANLAIAFLHDPEIVYLDEPTIGLDVLVKSKIRRFIKEVNREKKTTLILTTHDMDDIEEICNRLIMIDEGKILYDGSLTNFKTQFGNEYVLTIDFAEENIKITDSRFQLVKDQGKRKSFSIKRSVINPSEAITLIVRQHDITDIKINEVKVEDIVKNLYMEGFYGK
ncbi:ATP-binding cassette domain-containing protein [Evansella sp. AB-P1]|uniref:ABC transporter ATP-binding protein n=1 Tax=Evansella sp. AB-P1 TaxID=3037653 RepID=UPI00241E14AE|nr:ATP-binding cassette domain-containing protein [Evansella sp. AB-P1]MDG5788608.1 ATP-binding cassette domain-containing protein [Evansella sp. AB-P1]